MLGIILITLVAVSSGLSAHLILLCGLPGSNYYNVAERVFGRKLGDFLFLNSFDFYCYEIFFFRQHNLQGCVCHLDHRSSCGWVENKFIFKSCFFRHNIPQNKNGEIGYIKIVGDIVWEYFSAVANMDNELVTFIFTAVTIFPLLNLKEINRLRITSLISLILVLFNVVVIVYNSVKGKSLKI